ncbi:hypothetical protein PMAYCL1PPCAC_13597, partial [Pristionchus mayeri]
PPPPPRPPSHTLARHSLRILMSLHSDATSGNADGPHDGRNLPLSLVPALLRVLRGQSLPVLLLLRDLGAGLLRYSGNFDLHRWPRSCCSIRAHGMMKMILFRILFPMLSYSHFQ